MTTTATIDSKNILTVVTDNAFTDVQVQVGADPIVHIPATKNPITVTGMTATPLTNDKGVLKTTATFQLS